MQYPARKPCDRRGHPCQTLARGEEAKDESEGSWRGARRPRNARNGGIERPNCGVQGWIPNLKPLFSFLLGWCKVVQRLKK